MDLKIYHTVAERFLRYVKIDTQSDPASPTYPSTEKQKHLGELLVKEMREMGIKDAEMDEFGYVYGTIPSNTKKKVPVICFCSHMDTSPDSSGKDVKPLIHKNYDGKEIRLPKQNIIIKPSEHRELKNQKGNDIITSDGSTLLGADDKAGIAEILDAAQFLLQNPKIKHGKIRILFTPDEEIGRGVDKVNLKRLGADYGYTLDGETVGMLEDETFSADGVTITVNGVSMHPGFAKGKMVNAIKIAAKIIDALPQDKRSPETTEKREGFIHPLSISGTVEQAVLKFIIRDFTEAGLKKLEKTLEAITLRVLSKYKKATHKFEVQQQYRNMKLILDKHPQVSEYAIEAMRRAGLTPKRESIRGGTDGSRLSFMGLPCPNIFAGGHAFHSRQEWIAVQDMKKAVETIIYLCMVWEEKAN